MQNDQLNQIKGEWANIQEKYNQINACIECVDVVESDTDYSYLQNSMEYLNQRISDLWQQLFAHIDNGHLPPIEGADKMKKALKVLGLDGDYQVQPKVIYSSEGMPEKIMAVISHKSPPKGYPKTKKQYADPKNFKYPVDSEEHVRAAWSYINMTKNQKGYTPGEVTAIKSRIKEAGKKYGIDFSKD